VAPPLEVLPFLQGKARFFSTWRDNPLDFALLDNEASSSNNLLIYFRS